MPARTRGRDVTRRVSRTSSAAAPKTSTRDRSRAGADAASLDAKLIIAWWVAALARRLPPGMGVYAVSPGGATATKVVRSAGWALRNLFIPIVNLIPGMNQTPETAAGRYIQASEFGTDVSGQFFASAKGKFSGPIEVQRQPHLHDRASQEAAWQAVVKVSGVDLY